MYLGGVDDAKLDYCQRDIDVVGDRNLHRGAEYRKLPRRCD
jgi:hypothetical protein